MEQKIVVPDIGDIKDVEVIEILVQPDDAIDVEQSLITLESDKASMEIPAPFSGTVSNIIVKLGDRVSEGSGILNLRVSEKTETSSAAEAIPEASKTKEPEIEAVQDDDRMPVDSSLTAESSPGQAAPPSPSPLAEHRQTAHAGPSVRRFARELGADLTRITGSGRKGRILREDIKEFVKTSLRKPSTGELDLNRLLLQPDVDFSRFGEIESRPLSRIKKLAGAHLHQCWVGIPHVTQHGDADITELEAFRKSLKTELEPRGVRLTLLPFLMKAAVAALQRFSDFNASLSSGGEELILKKYYHIGVAVDTPEGLVVPVVRDVDKKGLAAIARELADLSAHARDKKLKPSDLQGGTFTISSLGGIGGSAFTPIINSPEVAILGVSRSETRPVFRDPGFVPRLILPMSLSYDHRVIDGAAAAHFVVFLGNVLGDLRRLLI